MTAMEYQLHQDENGKPSANAWCSHRKASLPFRLMQHPIPLTLRCTKRDHSLTANAGTFAAEVVSRHVRGYSTKCNT